MIRLHTWLILLSFGAFAQENVFSNLAPSFRECYDNKYLSEKDNRLPHTINTLVAILQKIENTEGSNMDLRRLTVAILHRFRRDGIVENPTIPKQSGVSPYASDIYQFAKFLQIRRFVPEKDTLLPYDIISDIERCTLHFMLSSSIEIYERGDEGTVCRFTDNAYRNARNIESNHSIHANFDIHDVETLTPEQIDVITNHKEGVTEDAIDPNALYPELPPNHPDIARIVELPPLSRCPVENGVVKTNWGSVSAGPLIAGIAAGLQPETIKLSELWQERQQHKNYPPGLTLDNKWIATLAGDIAEVALIQGPRKEKINVGVHGNWNSSSLPHWYFINSNEKLEFTTAEIRGDLDGLILANEIESLYSKIPTLKLSQVIDMYYSAHGLFNSSIRACNRRTLFTAVAPNSTMSAQAYSAALILREYLQKATMDDDVIERFAVEATNELAVYIPSSMNKDLSCTDIEKGNFNDIIQISVDLTIILDTTWPFDLIQPILATLLDNIKINQYNSQFTIINGYDGSVIINTTNSILDFGCYNETNYKNVTGDFNLAISLKKLGSLQTQKLNDERNKGIGGAKSDVVLIIPYRSSISNSDKTYCMQQLRIMRERVPDATILILTYGSKDRWSDFVSNSIDDLFSTTISDMQGTSPTIFSLISRIKQVPKRLFNTQCGADYSVVGKSNPFVDYIEPSTIVSYKMHPNYFFSSDTSRTSKIKIEGSGLSNLKVCTSRRLIHINSIENINATCTSLISNEHTISLSCGDADFIYQCQPLYLLVIANSSAISYQCTDTRVCRFPHMLKYTISYENLACVSGASINLLNTVFLVISMIYICSQYVA